MLLRLINCRIIINTANFADFVRRPKGNKKLSCRRQTARRFVSVNILLSHSRSLKVIRNDIVE